MVDNASRFEIMITLNQLKSFIREGFEIGEIGLREKEIILKNIGQIKQVILTDCDFKSQYKSGSEYSKKVKILR